jgi:hypothetical protein
MTRFVTFWVENGVIQAPLNVMRFDEPLYRMLGGEIACAHSGTKLILDPSTYGGRSTASSRMPGRSLMILHLHYRNTASIPQNAPLCQQRQRTATKNGEQRQRIETRTDTNTINEDCLPLPTLPLRLHPFQHDIKRRRRIARLAQPRVMRCDPPHILSALWTRIWVLVVDDRRFFFIAVSPERSKRRISGLYALSNSVSSASICLLETRRVCLLVESVESLVVVDLQ